MIATSYQLRDYQAEGVDGIERELRANQSTLAVCPTGGGKTIIFGEVTRRFLDKNPHKRVLIMAHRDELIRQACDKVGAIIGEPCDIEMADYQADTFGFDRARVVVTSVQTMSRVNRHRKFHPAEFGLLIVDEAHHAVAPSYLAVQEYFKQNEDLRVLGVTATPDRADELAMGRVFDSVAMEMGIVDMIEGGWLVPIQQQFVRVEGLDLSRVKTTAGDLNQRQLAEILNEERRCHQVVDPTLGIADGRQTLIFGTSVEQAELISEIANRHNPGCSDWICGDSVKCPRDRRRQILADFSRGEFQVLVNVGVLLEGYDEPRVEVVACARPTKSRSLYAQMVGRGTRTLPGVIDGLPSPEARTAAIAASDKPFLTVLDFVGNSGQHKLIHTGDILGGNYDDEIVAMATQSALNKSDRGERADMLAELRAAEEARKEARRKARQAIAAKAKYQTKTIDPFDVFDLSPKREPGWHKGRKPTEKQRKFLEKAGVATAKLSFWEASQLIGATIKRRDEKLCTFKQAKLLARFGESTDVGFEEASRKIDAIAKNGWKPLTQGE